LIPALFLFLMLRLAGRCADRRAIVIIVANARGGSSPGGLPAFGGG